jgi:nitrous oxide reductase
MGTNGITRRALLKIGAVGAVGGALTISGLAKMAADAGQAEAAAAATSGGAPLADPGELALTTLAGGVREGSLTVA